MDAAASRRAYDRDLAYIHHVGFGDFSREAAPGILSLFSRANIHAGLVVDLACGSGLWVRELQRSGYEAVGVDASTAMIALARTIAPGARFTCASLHGWELPRCDAVTCLGEGLNYLPDGSTEPLPIGPVIQRVADALRPGGMFVFDVIVSGKAAMNYRTWRTGDDWAVLIEVAEQAGTPLLTRDMTTFRKSGTTYRRAFERHAVQVFDRTAVETLLRDAGFSVKTSRRYGDAPLPTRRLAFVACKSVGPSHP